MPPLPSTIDSEASALIETLNRKYKDLSTFQIPRLRECKGPLSTQQQYAAELREDLEAFAQQVETLSLVAEDQKRKTDRMQVNRLVDEFRTSCSSIRKDMRAALLESKRTIDMQGRANREELLRPFAMKEKPKGTGKATDDALMSASNDVTDALRRTIGLMQGELERSVLSSQMLESSTATLRATSSTHDTLNSLMGTSKHLITALEKADWMDRLIIFASLGFFLLIVAFILKQRIFDRGLRVALWWTKFIPDFSGDAALLTSEKGDALTSTLSATASTLLSAPSASVIQDSPDIGCGDGKILDPVEQALSRLSITCNTGGPSGTASSIYDDGNTFDPVEEALSSLSLSSSNPTSATMSTATGTGHMHAEL